MEYKEKGELEADLTLLARLLAQRAVDVNDCWLWMGARTKAGYGSIWIGRDTWKYVHRAAAELFLGLDPTSDLHVLHSCDNPACFNPQHLSLGTHADNIRDAVRKGRMGKKLTNADVAEIKCMLAANKQRSAIAEEYGVTTETIGLIARGETWSHVSWPIPSDVRA